MIKNKQKLEKFYKKLMKKEKISYKKALLIYESLYREARSLGIISSKNVLDGLEVSQRIAKSINWRG